MALVLLADKVADNVVKTLSDAGLDVLNKPGLSQEELKDVLRDVDGVICRSGVTLTEDLLSEGRNLKAICRAGVGVDNIDIEAASRNGIVVMNTPGANTISTAEHTIALMLALARNIGPAYLSMRNGQWNRKQLTGAELSGATLGVVGLGRVGQAVARRAGALDMEVIGYDPFISRDLADKIGIELIEELNTLLGRCDYLTVHIPVTENTKGLIGRDEIALMKPCARIINCARGEVVDLESVLEAVKCGKLAGGAFDVYEEEPPKDFSFALNDRILATPHLGASTEAAQEAVGMQAADQMVDALRNENYRNALNITQVSPEEMRRLTPFCELAQKLGRCAGVLNRGRMESIKIVCKGEVSEYNVSPVEHSAIAGVMQDIVEDKVNIVSAPHLARERGIEAGSSCSKDTVGGFTNLVEVRLKTDQGNVSIRGTLLGKQHQRIVKIKGYDTEVIPDGHLLLVFGKDKPGLIGTVGEKLGKLGINIARMTFSREDCGGNALLVLNLDNECAPETVSELESLAGIEKAVPISL